MKKAVCIIRYAGGILLFVLGVVSGRQGLPALSSVLFFLLGLSEAALCFAERRKLLDVRAFLSLTWFAAVGLAVLDLSELQSSWALRTWISVGGFYFLLNAAYDVSLGALGRKARTLPESEPRFAFSSGGREEYRKRIFRAACAVFLAGFLSFLAESLVFSFDYPFFSDKPHAYTSFHITGLHYFVVSVVFVHPLSVMFCMLKYPDRKEKAALFFMNAMSVLICLLILSKFQLLFGLEMSLVVWLLLQKRFSGKQILLIAALCGVLALAGGTLMIVMRKYPDDYLEEIFAFRNRETPLAFQYVYIYMVNNFENLNLLVRGLGSYTFGRRCLYPFVCLTGLKFITGVANFVGTWTPYTCPELTTLTILYDVYGDFGLAGVSVFSVLLGAAAGCLCWLSEKRQSVFSLLLFAQILLYLFLAFFSTWLSNPTVWFGIALTVLISVYTEHERIKAYFRRRKNGAHQGQ